MLHLSKPHTRRTGGPERQECGWIVSETPPLRRKPAKDNRCVQPAIPPHAMAETDAVRDGIGA
jgi:hypothetical protein